MQLRQWVLGRTWGAAAACAAVLTLAPSAGDAQLLTGRDEDPVSSFQDCTVCPEMVIVQAGTFQMGGMRGDPDARSFELPRHSVNIAQPFAIGRHEVTFDDWEACVAYGGCTHEPDDYGFGRGDMPVVDVSWNDAKEYVQWLARHTGQPYRLPTEAEWEYAARGGAEGSFFWPGTIDDGCQFANVADRTALASFPDWITADCTDGFDIHSPVGSLRPNPFGLYDVLGNVYEYVEDCANDSYNLAPNDGSAWLSGNCEERMFRGGAARGLPEEVRLPERGFVGIDERSSYNGFRVALTLE